KELRGPEAVLQLQAALPVSFWIGPKPWDRGRAERLRQRACRAFCGESGRWVPSRKRLDHWIEWRHRGSLFSDSESSSRRRFNIAGWWSETGELAKQLRGNLDFARDDS